MEKSTKSYKKKIETIIQELDEIFTEYGSKERLELLENGLKSILFLFIGINQKSNLKDTNLIIDYVTKLCLQCNDSNVEKLPILVQYIGFFIHSINVDFFKDKEKRKNLIDSLISLIKYAGRELKVKGNKFTLKTQLVMLLNEIIRVFLNVPELINDFIIVTYNEYIFKEEEDFIIFSNLLLLLIYDINFDFQYLKLLRRSIIVYLSFDKLSYSQYLYNSKFVEVLVIKLCNLYEVLPNYFELNRETETLEVSINMKRSFSIMTKDYFSMVDYVRFLCKIVNCIVSRDLKNQFKHFFFNRFLIKMIQPKLLDKPNISRSHFQYLISILKYSNNDEIIDVTANFLFGFNDEKCEKKFECEEEMNQLINGGDNKKEKNKEIELIIDIKDDDLSDFNYTKHKSREICYKILNNMKNNYESINIITYELFELFFQKRPYLMVKKFIKPYVDFCLKHIPNKSKYLGNKSFPQTQSIEKFLKIYEKYDKSNLIENIDTNMLKNYNYYMSYDIDFYGYYLKEKDIQQDLNNQSVNENSVSFNDDNLLEESLNKKIEIPRIIQTDKKTEKTENKQEEKKTDDQTIKLDNVLFDKIDEIQQLTQNMNFLLMKNIQEKLMNYQNNTQIENLFLVNLILTIISVPILKFDPDLVICHSVLLDDDINSKYSILTVIKYIVQELSKEYLSDKNKIIEQNIIEKIKEFQEQDKLNKKRKEKTETFMDKKAINYIIFFEFLKEFMVSVMHKHKFEGLVENIYGFYSDLLDEYTNHTE